MGNSAAAKMFWGFPVEDEDVKGKLENWAEKYAAAKGVAAPEGEDDRDKYRAYLDEKAPVMKAKMEKEHARQITEIRAHYEAELAMARNACRSSRPSSAISLLRL